MFKNLSKSKKDTIVAYIFLSPWIIGFILFTGGPIIGSFVLSFMKWNMLGAPKFAGLGNYHSIFFGDGTYFYDSLRITFVFTSISVAVTLFSSLILALILNFKARFISVFQFIYFLPSVLPTVVMASVFKIILNKESGILNYGLYLLGITNAPNWLNDPFWVFVALGIISIFSFSTGQMMLIFYASLKEVSTELYEASNIDGANFLQKFVHITIPSISPIILFNLVISTISALGGSFALIYALTSGGPAKATEVLSLNIYTNAFGYFNMGYASALAVILFFIISFVTIIQFKISKNRVHY